MLSPGPGSDLGPSPIRERRPASTVASSMLRRADGQILPGLLVVLLALLAVGMMMFQVGKAALLRSGAQTAPTPPHWRARPRSSASSGRSGPPTAPPTSPCSTSALVLAKMRRVREEERRDVVESKVVIQGVDVKATVTTDPDLGKDGRAQSATTDGEGEAKARARVEISAGARRREHRPVPGGGGGLRPDAEDLRQGVEEARQEDRQGAPSCEDIVKLGKFLQAEGFLVGENAAFGGRPYKHEPGGYHYKCGNTGALDVNFGGAGDLDPQEVAAVDPIIDELRKLGFRTIWRAPDHYDHLHVDIANSGPIGAGSGGNDGGFAGPLEDVLLEVKLIDYDAPVRARSSGSAASAAATSPARPTRRPRARSAAWPATWARPRR